MRYDGATPSKRRPAEHPRAARPSLRWTARVAGAALLAMAWAPSAGGQTLRGTIRDAETGRAVSLAYVGLLAPGKELVVATLTEVNGQFVLQPRLPGAYLLYVARSGYTPMMDGLFELGEDGVLDVQVGLKPSPLELDSLMVVVAHELRDLRTVGFYSRKAIGLGHFIERNEIQRAAVDHLVDALRGLPAVRITTPRPSPLTAEGVRNPRILIRQATGFCAPTLYVDGNMVDGGGNSSVRPDDFVDPSEVEAVEIYTRPAEIPLGFSTPGGCGLLLIWTRFR